jgi:hypothetical protein
MLHVDDFRKPWNHYQRVMEMVSRPGLIHQLIGNHILTRLESFRNFHPISNEEISQAVVVVPECTKRFGNCVTEIELGPWVFAAVFLRRISVLIECKFFDI